MRLTQRCCAVQINKTFPVDPLPLSRIGYEHGLTKGSDPQPKQMDPVPRSKGGLGGHARDGGAADPAV